MGAEDSLCIPRGEWWLSGSRASDKLVGIESQVILLFVSLLALVEHIAPSIKNVITYPCLVLRINLCIFIQNKFQDLVPPTIGCRVHRSPQS